MSGTGDTRRIVSAHRLPIALEPPHARAANSAQRPGAAFVAQVLATREHRPLERARFGHGGEASCAYRRTDQSDTKRLPAGYRKAVNV